MGTRPNGRSFMGRMDSKAGFADYIRQMRKSAPAFLANPLVRPLALTALILLAVLLLSATGAFAQIVPEDPAVARARTEAQINQQLQQTQLNNIQVQQGLQQNDIRQQQLFNSMPPPAFQQQQQPQIYVPPAKP